MSQLFSLIIPKIFYLVRFPFQRITTDHSGDQSTNIITISLTICNVMVISIIFYFCHSLTPLYTTKNGSVNTLKIDNGTKCM